MAVTVVHATQSAKPDSGDGRISSNAWNEGHSVEGLGTAAEADASDFAAATHTHAIADVTGLQTALDGKLASAANLSDLASAATARTNLDVYSKSEVDSAVAGGGAALIPAVNVSGRYFPPDSMIFGAGNSAVAANSINFYPFSKSVAIDALLLQVTTAGAASTKARAGIYTANAVTGLPDTLIAEASAEAAVDSTGLKVLTLPSTHDVTEMVWLAFVSSGAPTVSAGTVDSAHCMGGTGLTSAASFVRVVATFPYAALPADTSALTFFFNSTTNMLAARVA